MLLGLARLLFFQIVLVLIALIEAAVGLPFVTVTFFLVTVISFSTVSSLIFLAASSLLLAAIFTESWLLLSFLLGLGALLFRSKFFRSRGIIAPRLLVVLLLGLIIGSVHQPSITQSFVIHSLVSSVISAMILWRYVKYVGRRLDINTIWFGRQ